MKNFSAALAINQEIISREVHGLRNYADAMERVVAAEADRESYSLEESTRYLTPDEQAEVYAENAEYLDSVTDHFIFQHRLSLIATIHAVFECHLVHLCKMLCTQRNLNFVLRDLSGNSNLDKARKLLDKFLNVPLDTAQWQKMEQFSKLRNIASHLNGQLTEDGMSKLKGIEASFPGILDHDSTSIKPKHCAAFCLLEAVNIFYSSLYQTLDKWGQLKPVDP